MSQFYYNRTLSLTSPYRSCTWAPAILGVIFRHILISLSEMSSVGHIFAEDLLTTSFFTSSPPSWLQLSSSLSKSTKVLSFFRRNRVTTSVTTNELFRRLKIRDSRNGEDFRREARSGDSISQRSPTRL